MSLVWTPQIPIARVTTTDTKLSYEPSGPPYTADLFLSTITVTRSGTTITGKINPVGTGPSTGGGVARIKVDSATFNALHAAAAPGISLEIRYDNATLNVVDIKQRTAPVAASVVSGATA